MPLEKRNNKLYVATLKMAKMQIPQYKISAHEHVLAKWAGGFPFAVRVTAKCHLKNARASQTLCFMCLVK